jgi:acetyltransferase-like isoleucine patch superfamily enzyme
MKFGLKIISKLPERSLLKGLRLEIESVIVTVVGSLPGFFGMILRNVFYRFLFKELKGFSLIQNRVVFVNTENLSVGKFFGCNSNSYINALGEIRIGNNVLIGNNVTVSAGFHSIDKLKSSIFEQPSTPRRISIEDGVWIGAGAVIMPGVNLKEGSVIGANSVVTKDTEPMGVYIGAPAKLIRYRNVDGS